MLSAILTAGRLALAITSAEVPPDRAWRAAVAITIASDEFDPALIAAIAFGESRYQPGAVSPDGLDCGPMGVRTRNAARCRRLRRDELYAYRAGVQKLRDARAFCARRGDATIVCQLAGYASGPAGVRGGWHAVPRKVLRRAVDIGARMGVPGGAA